MKQLQEIQSELKAPKNQRNNFGKYNYRSCEDILEAVKPLLAKYKCTLTLSDEVKELGGLIFVESTAVIKDDNDITKFEIAKAQAGIDPNRKGMDIAQSFGSSSSYSRKYALNGLFLIDDTKDADSTNTHEKAPKTETKELEWLNKGTPEFLKVKSYLLDGGKMENVLKKYKVAVRTQELLKETF
tara:strand:+ start:5436 stop:5990 length:555 start_codon:yes stop_codon:yes gene_type:complete